MRVFIDLSAILAVMNAADTRHSEASIAWRGMLLDGAAIVTSSYVIVETAVLLQRRHGVAALRRFVEQMLPAIEIVWVDAAIHAVAMSAVLSMEGEDSPGIVDCVNFELVRTHRVDRVFAYDKHFTVRGYSLVGQS